MNANTAELKSIAQQFFSAYDAHDVEGMIAFFADDALGWYIPYGPESVMPIRGGIEAIWRAFPQAVPDFGVEIVELIPAEGSIVVAQAIVGGSVTPEQDPLNVAKDSVAKIPHVFILRFNEQYKITRLDVYWDNAAINGIKASAL
jgi:steroid delta-isomerase-like uncharacterized protein